MAAGDTPVTRLDPRLLGFSSICYGATFASWLLFPTSPGFAAGFALWGLSSALSSGTFQALAYDEPAAIGARDQYARVMGVGASLTLVAMASATRLRNQRRYRSRSPAVTVFAGFAWGSGVYSLTALVAVLAAIVVVLGPLIIWWMPQGDRTNSANDPPPG